MSEPDEPAPISKAAEGVDEVRVRAQARAQVWAVLEAATEPQGRAFLLSLSDPSAARGVAGAVTRYAAGTAPGAIGLDGLPATLLARLDSEDEDTAEAAAATTVLALLCGVAWRAGRQQLTVTVADLEAMAAVLRFEQALVRLKQDEILGDYASADRPDRTPLGSALRLWLEELVSEEGLPPGTSL